MSRVHALCAAIDALGAGLNDADNADLVLALLEILGNLASDPRIPDASAPAALAAVLAGGFQRAVVH